MELEDSKESFKLEDSILLLVAPSGKAQNYSSALLNINSHTEARWETSESWEPVLMIHYNNAKIQNYEGRFYFK